VLAHRQTIGALTTVHLVRRGSRTMKLTRLFKRLFSRKKPEKPIVVWPGDRDYDYGELRDMEIDPHGFIEECGDR